MASHLDEVTTAFNKCRDEAKRLEKEWAKAKPQDKDKLKKMAEACHKMAVSYLAMVSSAVEKDKKEMGEILHEINPALHF
jgi:hypothetical protein